MARAIGRDERQAHASPSCPTQRTAATGVTSSSPQADAVRLRRRWMSVIALVVAACSGVAPIASTNDASANSSTLWQVVEALVRGMPFSVARVEAVLHNRLDDDAQRSNEAFRFYKNAYKNKSDAVSLNGGVIVRDLDLRVRRSPPHSAFLVLGLAGRCITLDELRKHYADLRITGVPRDGSADEATTYSSSASWGASILRIQGVASKVRRVRVVRSRRAAMSTRKRRRVPVER